jgi:type IV pilus assembly protein PilO
MPAQLGIAAAIAVVVLAGGFYGLVKPMTEENKKAADKLQAQKQQNDTLRKYERDLPALEAQIAGLKMQLEIQKKIVPDEKEADQFMHMMQETATAAGVQVRRYTSKTVNTHEYYTELPFDMDIDGPYYGVLNFFERVAKLERIINIGGLKMATPARSSEAGVKKKYPYDPTESVVASITATTFFSHEPSAVPPPPPAKGGKAPAKPAGAK